MVRQCHLNTCPVGIATQREDLRAKYAGEVEQVVALFRMLAEEARRYLALLGARSLAEVVGRSDLLAPVDHPLAASLGPLLVRSDSRPRHPGYRPFQVSNLSRRLAVEAEGAIESRTPIHLSYPISNTDRTVGARLSGMVTSRYGAEGLAEGSVSVTLSGTAGQSFGVWLAPGVSLRLDGAANDYVGKGMGGGRIVVVPRRDEGDAVPQAGGNAVMYGATGGILLMSGMVGQRFAVRNSGGTAVVEGCSDHGCEYMTGGMVVILGPVGGQFCGGNDRRGELRLGPRVPTSQLSGRDFSGCAPTHRSGRRRDSPPATPSYPAHQECGGGAGFERLATGGGPRFWVLEAARRVPLEPTPPLLASAIH